MEELLQNPAVQAGVLPFIAGLVLAAFLRNTRQLGLAIAVAFVCAVGLTMGLGFESLTSVPGGHPKCPTYGHPNCSTVAALI